MSNSPKVREALKKLAKHWDQEYGLTATKETSFGTVVQSRMKIPALRKEFYEEIYLFDVGRYISTPTKPGELYKIVRHARPSQGDIKNSRYHIIRAKTNITMHIDKVDCEWYYSYATQAQLTLFGIKE